METTYSIEIDTTPDRVFYWLDDPQRVMKWLSSIVENENLHETRDKVGTTFRQVVDENGRRMEVHGTVTAYETNERLAIHLNAKGFEVDAEYRLMKIAGGTRLSQTSEVHFQGFMKLMGPLIAVFMKKAWLKQLEKDFGKLKTLCENGAD